MFCGNCGAKIAQGEKFCGECGSPIEKVTDNVGTGNTLTTQPISKSMVIRVCMIISLIFMPFTFLMPFFEVNVYSNKITLSIADILSNFDKIEYILSLSSSTAKNALDTIVAIFVCMCIFLVIEFVIVLFFETSKRYDMYTLCAVIPTLFICLYIFIFSWICNASNSYIKLQDYLSIGYYLFIILNIAVIILSIITKLINKPKSLSTI